MCRLVVFFFFSSRRRHTRCSRDWSSDVCSSDLITALNTFLFKAVRFRALQDAPHAFGSTYAEEAQLTDSDWIKRVERWNGESGAGFSRWIGILRAASLAHFSMKMIRDRKSTRLNSSHGYISYAVFCLKKKKQISTYSDDYSLAPVTSKLRTSLNIL